MSGEGDELLGPLASPDAYARFAAELARIAATYHFEQSKQGLIPGMPEVELRAHFSDEFPEQGWSPAEVAERLQRGFMCGLTGISNPRFLGYILTRPAPEGHVFDILANATHASPGAAHLALSGTLLERQALRWLADGMGLSPGDALFTTGGCESLLLAIKCARDAALGSRRANENMVLFASENSHYCVDRAWDIVGGAKENLIKFDPKKLEALERDISQHKRSGALVVAIVAAIGSTNTGEIEPASELLAIAERCHCWLHLDAAYGGPALMLEEFAYLREPARGAHSISMDGHKWLGLPLGTSMVFLREGLSLRDSFSFRAVFTDEATLSVSEPDQCQQGIQGTRMLYGLRVWAMLALTGRELIKARLRRTLDVARAMAERIRRSDRLELLEAPELTVLSFTAREADAASLVGYARELALAGEGFITVTRHKGRPCLRAAIVSHETTTEIVCRLVDQLEGLIAARGAYSEP